MTVARTTTASISTRAVTTTKGRTYLNKASVTRTCSSRDLLAHVRDDEHEQVSALSQHSAAQPLSSRRLLLSSTIALSLGAFSLSTSSAQAATTRQKGPAEEVVPDADSALVQKLLERTRENKEAYDQQRLDNYYNRKYRINEITGMEILPEPCDPRDPEFRNKCTTLPRLPQDRLF
ncbi:hypothetical protein NFJ02_09g142210 [Pycnococcus provasolii]